MIGAPIALAAAALAGSEAAERTPLAFIHVEANVGGASGGHTALRIGGSVYHFQQGDDDLLRLVRDDWNGFRHCYAGLQNRPLHLAYVDAANDDVERIARRFSRAWVEQQADFDRAARRRDDAEWLAALRDGTPLPALRGVGLLAEEATPAADDGAAELRQAVAAALGPEFLRSELARIDAALAAYRLPTATTDLEPWRELLSARAALRAIEGEAPLAPGVVTEEVELAPLTDGERLGIARVRDAQAAAIVALLRSARPDRGFALHVAIARHHAAARSLAQGRLCLLDPFPDDAPRSTADEAGTPATRAAMARLGERALQGVRELRAAALGPETLEGTFDEARFNALEDLTARCREVQCGAGGDPARWIRGRMVPSRGRVVVAPLVDAGAADLARAAATARLVAEDVERELAARFSYALVERNCVTELVRLLDEAFPDAASAANALGARLEPGEGLSFIPFVFHDEVVAQLRIVREETIQNHRMEELARVEAADPGAFTALREATTLSSTIYSPRASDGEFLFFTDDVLWQRPLRGVANVGWGVGQGLLGVVTAPFDGGRRFRAGFHGAFFSLPELVFGNVRKGSFDFVEPPTE